MSNSMFSIKRKNIAIGELFVAIPAKGVMLIDPSIGYTSLKFGNGINSYNNLPAIDVDKISTDNEEL